MEFPKFALHDCVMNLVTCGNEVEYLLKEFFGVDTKYIIGIRHLVHTYGPCPRSKAKRKTISSKFMRLPNDKVNLRIFAGLRRQCREACVDPQLPKGTANINLTLSFDNMPKSNEGWKK
jgi:hypothetical protein